MCEANEDMNHIYQCYEKIYNGNIIEQTQVFRNFEKNMKKRNEEKTKKRNLPCDPFCDPLNCGKFSIG